RGRGRLRVVFRQLVGQVGQRVADLGLERLVLGVAPRPLGERLHVRLRQLLLARVGVAPREVVLAAAQLGELCEQIADFGFRERPAAAGLGGGEQLVDLAEERVGQEARRNDGRVPGRAGRAGAGRERAQGRTARHEQRGDEDENGQQRRRRLFARYVGRRVERAPVDRLQAFGGSGGGKLDQGIRLRHGYGGQGRLLHGC